MRKLGAVESCLLLLATLLATMASVAEPARANAFSSAAVGLALSPGGQGWWVARANGSVTPGGTAASYGSAAALNLAKPIVGIAATPSGHGYWLVASDGGIFAFGDAAFFGSTGSIRLNQPIAGMASTPSGRGYWLVASDGGIFAFGDAAFFGSAGSIHLNKPIVAVAATETGHGYWLVASDGGIFAFGDAAFFGSTGSIRLNQPIVGMAPAPGGVGYWLVAADGGVFSFGSARFAGSAAGSTTAQVVAVAASGVGYAVAAADGLVSAFGNAATAPGGVAMPTGNLPGWQMVFSDDFNGTSLNQDAWGPYSGQPGGDPGGWWDPSHVVVRNGMLELQNYRDPAFGNRWVSGGVSSAPALKQTYGKYLVRFRIDKGNGIAGIALLWPSGDGWPPEIDFAEDGGGNRAETTATLHYGAGDSQIARSVSADFSLWHTIGVEWTPGHLSYTLDGAFWGTVSDANVPAQPMEMDLQTQAGTCGDQLTSCPDVTTPAEVTMQVDWVVAYQPA